MSTFIHETAIVDAAAEIGEGCHIGPFSVIGSGVVLAENIRVESHTVIDGDNNQIREFVTIHRGTAGGGGLTKIGSGNLLMAQAHVAHDCQIGDGVIMANAATLAGHVEIADRANVGAFSGIHQFCRVGVEAFIGGYSVVVKDAPPYAIIQGNHAKCYGLNRIGMKRRGYSEASMQMLNRAYHLLLSSKLNTSQALERIKAEITGCAEVDVLVDFIETSKRGVVK